MRVRLGYCVLILVGMMLACTPKKEAPVDSNLLPGKYADDINGRDSIFVYADKSYKHTYHRADGKVKSQTGTWRFDPNDIFFEHFVFYNDGEPGGDGYFSGTWSPRVFVTENQVKLRYSERVFYVREKK